MDLLKKSLSKNVPSIRKFQGLDHSSYQLQTLFQHNVPHAHVPCTTHTMLTSVLQIQSHSSVAHLCYIALSSGVQGRHRRRTDSASYINVAATPPPHTHTPPRQKQVGQYVKQSSSSRRVVPGLQPNRKTVKKKIVYALKSWRKA